MRASVGITWGMECRREERERETSSSKISGLTFKTFVRGNFSRPYELYIFRELFCRRRPLLIPRCAREENAVVANLPQCDWLTIYIYIRWLTLIDSYYLFSNFPECACGCNSWVIRPVMWVFFFIFKYFQCIILCLITAKQFKSKLFAPSLVFLGIFLPEIYSTFHYKKKGRKQ